MRILIINPNTNALMTDRMLREAERLDHPGVAWSASTGRFGAPYIASRAASAIAGHAALEAFARDGAGCDAVLLACFGDPGLAALKELSPVPVIGMAEASCLVACTLARRFSIVTGGERWPEMLEEFLAAQGLSSRLASIRAVAPTGDMIARDPDRARAVLADAVRDCVGEDGAGAVILAGAGLVGLAETLADVVDVPVLCSFRAAAEATVAIARLHPREPKAGAFAATPAMETSGLSEALAALLAKGPTTDGR
jgi:allantoin racemase